MGNIGLGNVGTDAAGLGTGSGLLRTSRDSLGLGTGSGLLTTCGEFPEMTSSHNLSDSFLPSFRCSLVNAFLPR